MANNVMAKLLFHFKGEAFEPKCCIDLDMFFQSHNDESFIYDMLAKSIGLDEYRHEYDVMVMEDIVYSEATGIAVDYVQNGQVDWQGLEKAWKDQQDLQVLNPIANKFFNVENLEDDPKLAGALLAAYRQGKQESDATAAINKGLYEGFYG